jgi:hypothetical protein
MYIRETFFFLSFTYDLKILQMVFKNIDTYFTVHSFIKKEQLKSLTFTI